MPRTQVEKESVLLLGGARSGKSAYAQQRALEWDGRLIYLATAVGTDAETKKRIAAHRAKRRNRRWLTIEEPTAVVWQMKELDDSVGGVVLDCVTLWVANALLHDQRDEMENQIAELVEEIPLFPFHFLAVSNEVGLGTMPDTPFSREYRDVLGAVNQQLAKACKEVVFMTAGLPLKIKGY